MSTILVLSAGTRNKIIRYFVEAFGPDGGVVAADMSPYAPALYETDRRCLVPPIWDGDYTAHVLEICDRFHVDGVLSLIDPELSVLAGMKNEFLERDIKLVGSDGEQCERALDKMKMHRWLRDHDYPTARSYSGSLETTAAINSGELEFPCIVKPVRGSASVSVERVDSSDRLMHIMDHAGWDELMSQELLSGQEIGVDAYVDLCSGELVSLFTKKKLSMRAGETEKAVSFKDSDLFDYLDAFISESGFSGPVDIDLFNVGGTYYISEVNPRFGGGYPLAYECGCNFMDLIKRNLSGEANQRRIGGYEENVCMMKYNDLLVIPESDLLAIGV